MKTAVFTAVLAAAPFPLLACGAGAGASYGDGLDGASSTATDGPDQGESGMGAPSAGTASTGATPGIAASGAGGSGGGTSGAEGSGTGASGAGGSATGGSGAGTSGSAGAGTGVSGTDGVVSVQTCIDSAFIGSGVDSTCQTCMCECDAATAMACDENCWKLANCTYFQCEQMMNQGESSEDACIGKHCMQYVVGNSGSAADAVSTSPGGNCFETCSTDVAVAFGDSSCSEFWKMMF